MGRYKLTIAYEGTAFHGWQKQEPPESSSHAGDPSLQAGEPGRVAMRTVQAVVEKAVRETVRERVLVVGASRTDAGVHARGQVAAFTSSRREPGRGWPEDRGTEPLMRAINSRLPEDVLVVGCEMVADSFDPISDCTGKGYSYTLHVSPRRPLWDRRRVTHVWTPLDVEAMRAASERIVGRHDFAAFAAAGHGRQSTVRTVHACEVTGTAMEDEGESWARRVRIDVSGDGFLYNMVRIIAGTLVEVGRGRMSAEDVRKAIESGERRRAGPTLGPEGLCLEWVGYEREASGP